MATEQFSNAATTTLNGAITNVATSLVVASAASFPTVPQFRILVESELMLVTAVSGTTYTVTRGIEGTTAAAHATGVNVAHVVTAVALSTYTSSYVIQPRHNNLLGWTFDPAAAVSGGAGKTAGTVYLAKIYVPATITITNILIGVVTAGATLTASQNFAGLYDSGGNLLSATADQSGNWTSTGMKTMALTAAQTVTGGPDVWVYAAILFNGTTGPQLLRQSSALSASPNVGLTAAQGLRYGSVLTAQTTLPSSITLANMANTSEPHWAGLS